MKNYVGRKIRGFRFEDRAWNEDMASYIGKVGLIIKHSPKYVVAEFEDDNTWLYPISLIEPHLIDECTCENTGDNTCNYCEELQDRAILEDAKSKMQTPEIPQLGEGVLMEVSDDGADWGEAYIIAKLPDGRFLATNKLTWEHARTIPQLPQYTHAELVEKLGHDFEYINK
jgi:hypothetical protein